MKNSRKIAKEKTKENLMNAAKKLIKEKGIINLTTIEVAKEAGVAHGTVFVHFLNRDILFTEVINNDLMRIAKKLHDLAEFNNDIKLLLENYFDLLGEEEELFSVLAREFSFLTENIQRNIFSTESIIRNILYKAIETGINQKLYKPMDITMSLFFLFGTITYYLARSELFKLKDQSLIASKKDQIIDYFIHMLKL